MIETEKFYLFDVGLTNYLSRRKPSMGTPEFGKSFEHFIFMELKAFQAYSNPELEIHYWRTASGYEVDFILDDMNVAIEIKSSSKIHSGHTKGLNALLEEHTVNKAIIVSTVKQAITVSKGIHVLPWQQFLEMLWQG
ncbi:MAG: hypothetical protein OMM_13464, partial [Candidatus Magnetoglobus multicellularis str. Araruama]